MYCPKCGHKNTDAANFCGGCGKPMHGSNNNKTFLAIVLALLISGAGYGYVTDWSFEWPKETVASTKVEDTSAGEKELRIKKSAYCYQ